MKNKLKILTAVCIVAVVISTVYGWMTKKSFERLKVSFVEKMPVDPTKLVDNYYKFRGGSSSSGAEAVTLRGAKSGVKFPWDKMEEEKKFFVIGALWATAMGLHSTGTLNEKVSLYGVDELTVKDALIDLLEDLREGITFLGGENQSVLSNIDELIKMVKKEPLSTTEVNQDIAAKFEFVGTEMNKYVVSEYGETYFTFVEFGAWVAWLKRLGIAMQTAEYLGKKKLVEDLTDMGLTLLEYTPMYERLCTIYSLPGAVSRNVKTISSIYKEVTAGKNIVNYAGKILSAAKNIESVFFWEEIKHKKRLNK